MTQDAHSMNRFKKLRVMNLFLIQLGWKLHWFRTLHFAITKQSPMSLIRAGSKLCRTVGLQELGWRPLHKVSQPQFNTEPTCYITNWNKNEITDLSRLGQDSDALQAKHDINTTKTCFMELLKTRPDFLFEVAYLYLGLLDFNKLHD